MKTSLLLLAGVVCCAADRGDRGALETCEKVALPLVTDSAMVVPSSRSQLRAVCRKWYLFVDCINKLVTPGYTLSQKSALNDAVQTSIGSVHKMCSDPGYSEEYLVHAACIQKMTTEPRRCGMHYTSMATAALAEPASDRELCCLYQEFRACMRADRGCPETPADGPLSRFIDTFLDNGLQVFVQKCHRFRDRHYCRQLGTDTRQPPAEHVRAGHSRPEHAAVPTDRQHRPQYSHDRRDRPEYRPDRQHRPAFRPDRRDHLRGGQEPFGGRPHRQGWPAGPGDRADQPPSRQLGRDGRDRDEMARRRDGRRDRPDQLTEGQRRPRRPVQPELYHTRPHRPQYIRDRPHVRDTPYGAADRQLRRQDTSDRQLQRQDTSDRRQQGQDTSDRQLQRQDTSDRQLQRQDTSDRQHRRQDTSDRPRQHQDTSDRQHRRQDIPKRQDRPESTDRRHDRPTVVHDHPEDIGPLSSRPERLWRQQDRSERHRDRQRLQGAAEARGRVRDEHQGQDRRPGASGPPTTDYGKSPQQTRGLEEANISRGGPEPPARQAILAGRTDGPGDRQRSAATQRQHDRQQPDHSPVTKEANGPGGGGRRPSVESGRRRADGAGVADGAGGRSPGAGDSVARDADPRVTAARPATATGSSSSRLPVRRPPAHVATSSADGDLPDGGSQLENTVDTGPAADGRAHDASSTSQEDRAGRGAAVAAAAAEAAAAAPGAVGRPALQSAAGGTRRPTTTTAYSGWFQARPSTQVLSNVLVDEVAAERRYSYSSAEPTGVVCLPLALGLAVALVAAW